jgi:hypothetical protein
LETVAGSWHFLEYILYGIFIDGILKEKGQHYYDSQKICHEYWKDTSMSDAELEKFLAEIPPDNIAMMISAKAGMSVERYSKFVEANFIN